MRIAVRGNELAGDLRSGLLRSETKTAGEDGTMTQPMITRKSDSQIQQERLVYRVQ